MHIAEGFLPPVHAAAWTVAAAPFVIHGTRAIAKTVKEHPDAKLLLGAVGAFGREMTSGQGYIALAALIFSRWHPIYATLAALLFGFASNLKTLASQVGAQIPPELLAMIPYIVTILAVAGFVGQSRAPAASGKPYFKS